MSTPPMDPYKVLGVTMDAQLADIRTAHRKLVLKCHPDKVADPALKAVKQDEFQKVQQAYEMLSDEEARQKCDDLLKLHSLRERMTYTNKANSSSPRTPQYREFEIRTAEPPRQKAYRETTPREAPPNVKIFSTYARESSRGPERGPRYYEDGRSSRRGESYSEKPLKRESEKDRDKRDEKERRKEKDRKKLERERQKDDEIREEAARKAAKKEARKLREKQDDVKKRRDKEEKRREREHTTYIEEEDEVLHKRGKPSKYETRERSSGREDAAPPPVRRVHTDVPQVASSKINNARAYIHRSQTSGPPDRTTSYHGREPQPPAAPTPPPAPSGQFGAPEEDDARRSSARPRRGSSDVPRMSREPNMHRSSRDPVEEDPLIVNASPAAARTRYTNGPISESPPPSRLNRTNTMPVSGEKASRAAPRRAQTYSEGPEVAGNRGRGRSKMYAQAEIVSEPEEEYDAPPRRTKHRSRKERTPDRGQEIRYHVDNGRTKLQSANSYSRSLPKQQQPTTYTNYGYADYEPARSTRPEYQRGASYANYKVRQGRSYDTGDVAYSHFEAPSHAQYADDRVYAA